MSLFSRRSILALSLLCAAGMSAGISALEDISKPLVSKSVASKKQAPAYAVVSDDGKHAVATVQPLATQAALDIYQQGGNAIDAALAAAFTLGVVDSHNSGIGGGLFIIAHLADGEVIAIDGREMAPSAATKDMFIREGVAVPELSKTGALAVGVPGSVQALYELQQRAGKLSFADTLAPGIEIAEQGFAIDHVLAARLQRSKKKLQAFPETEKVFMPKGQPLTTGDILKQQDLANTYRMLAKQGPKYFYKGDFAKKLDQWMQANGGILNAADMATYKTIERAALRSSFMGYELVGFPPPSSGGMHVSQILKMMELQTAYKQPELDRYHRYIESSKRAFADRAHWMGDSDFVSVPRGLDSPAYLKKRIADISHLSATENLTYGTPEDWKSNIFAKHTTHVVTADKLGNWVSLTTTLNTSFGSAVMVPGTGVVMNNQMDDFAAQPGIPNAFGLLGSEANAVAAGKRPLSSMSPSLVLKDGKPVMALGAAGGPTIISQVAQVMQNVLALDMELEQAMATPRVHHQWKPNLVFVDGFMDEQLKEGLTKRGHNLKIWPAFGATQAILLKDGQFQAESEPRIQPERLKQLNKKP
ncbi:gamma-glutamyltransferase [Agaribacterium sp. ZY112]|uniref:gamma-glutamyltransferase n=1 Tax=Agaribacterium sp. ZY112 TaxID=3233574 RepID=UPI003524BA65